MRINKFLSEMGFCSRRQADQYITEGRIDIDGVPADRGSRIVEGQEVSLDGKRIGKLEDIRYIRPVLLAVNKPRGIVCTTTAHDRAKNIVELINYPIRVYPIGRLDKDSRGLILMTNQGDLVNSIMKPRYFHEKEYLVEVDHIITKEFLKSMRFGVLLPELKVRTRECRVEQISERKFRIILTQGLNRQIRRMCKALGYEVVDLQRVRILNIALENLPEGKYHEISEEEQKKLRQLLEDEKIDRKFGSSR